MRSAFGIEMTCSKPPLSFPIKPLHVEAAGSPGSGMRQQKQAARKTAALHCSNCTPPPAVAGFPAKIIKFKFIYIYIYIYKHGHTNTLYLPIASSRANHLHYTFHAISHNYESHKDANKEKPRSLGGGGQLQGRHHRVRRSLVLPKNL